MIAIAGAKGGCGKTVTTLGLAESFARTGTDAIAIDADRQLPNLHVVGGVDREPTLSAWSADTSIREVAQPSPRVSNAGLVPAPESADRLDVESTLASIDSDTVQPIVDCPSGAGPDVVDALSAADGVIIVTTGGDRSLAAARTTIEMAQRLAVPVFGLVANRCSTVPDAIQSWLDVPVLGVVPETNDPLADEAAIDAYETIVEVLRTRNVTSLTPPAYDETLLPTGITPLDRRLGGGLAPGSLAVVTAEPASQSEHLCYRAAVPRGTLYLSTERTEANVTHAIESAGVDAGTPTIRHVGGPDALEEAATLIGNLPEATTLIIDPIDVLERHDRAAYVSVLNALKTRLVDTGSLALLHCYRDPRPENRSATLHAADAVFDLQTSASEPDAAVDRFLSVPKFRPNARGIEPVSLTFGAETEPTAE